jgi:hypothetical protein
METTIFWSGAVLSAENAGGDTGATATAVTVFFVLNNYQRASSLPGPAEELKRGEDDGGGFFGKVILREIFAADPAGVNHIGIRLEAPTSSPADVIHDDVVVAHPIPIAGDAVKYTKDLQRLNVESSLLFKFTPHAISQFLSEFNQTSRNRPFAL